MRIRQSFCYPLYQATGMSLDALFAAVADIGYVAVELWQPDDTLEQFVECAVSHGLVVASMCGQQSLEDGLNIRSNHDRIERELRASIDRAVRLGIPNLICFSGNRQPSMRERDAIEAVADGLKRVADYAEDKGVTLNLELLNSKIDHPGYQCDRTAWGVAVCEKVASPRVRLLYDIYHMQIMEGDVIRTIREHVGWIGHFHTAGVPGRRDLDETQELNYTAICQAIAEAHFEGYLAHEFKPKGDPVDALRAAFAICDQG